MTSTDYLIEKYRLTAVTLTPLHIGSGEQENNEILLHPVTGMPFIQASGISGVFRAVSERINGSALTTKLFGQSHTDENDSVADVGSRIRFTDGEFDLDTVKMEIRPRVSIDSVSGTVSSSKTSGSGNRTGHKFDKELIGSGAGFVFNLYLFHQDDDLKTALEAVLAECMQERVRIGGQKSNGSGVIGLRSLEHCSFDMRKPDSRNAWTNEHLMDTSEAAGGHRKNVASYHRITDLKPSMDKASFAYEIDVIGQTEGALLVKGIAVNAFGAGAPDAMNMQNADRDYIVPGSSLKGTLRSHMNWIAGHMGKKGLVGVSFGEKAKDGTGNRGIVQVRDVLVGKKEKDIQTLLQHRIHIDKFTGGVMNGGLFAEEVISGSVGIHIDLENRKDPAATAGLLLLALRDLGAGVFNLGSGYNVGRGFIRMKTLRLRSLADERCACIDFETGTIDDKDGLIHDSLQALQDWRE